MVNQWNFGISDLSSSYQDRFYDIWHDQYQITHQKGFWIYLSFNGNDKTNIPRASNFNNTVSEVEFTASYTKLQECNYINVKYTVTNKASTRRTISIGVRCDIDINVNDGADQRNLEGFKGVKFINPSTNQDAIFLLRDSYGVTDVDTYYFWHGSGSIDDYIFNNGTNYADTSNVDAWIFYSWKNRVYEPGETKVFTHSIGTGEYITGYTYKLEEKFSEYYLPTETISANLLINSLTIGDTLTVKRCIDEEACQQIYSSTDEGNNFNIPDSFRITKIGYHTVRYITINNQSVEFTQNHTFIVNIPPTLYLNDQLKAKYYSHEIVNISISVSDDFYADVLVVDDTLALAQQISVISNGVMNQTYFTFQIPQYQIGSQHRLSIFASDLYLEKSQIFNHTFIVGGIPPDFSLKSKVPMLSYPTTNKFLAIEGLVRNKVGSDKLICYTSINNQRSIENDAVYLPDNEWHNFTILRSLSKIPLEPNQYNNVSLYFENSQFDQSEITTFYFEAIFYLVYKCSFKCGISSNYAFWFTSMFIS